MKIRYICEKIGDGFRAKEQDYTSNQMTMTYDKDLAATYSTKKRALVAFGCKVRNVESDWVKERFVFHEFDEMQVVRAKIRSFMKELPAADYVEIFKEELANFIDNTGP